MKQIASVVFTLAALVVAPALHGADANTQTSAASCPAGGVCPAAAATADCGADSDKPCCATAPTGLTKVEYQVQALACADCETKVTQALTGIKGVGTASACSQAKQVQVAYDAKLVKDRDLLAAIQKAGFKVDTETVQVKVEGMKCEACSGKVSQALTQVQGVKEQSVCHESGSATVKFDPAAVSREKVLAAIDGSGFQVIQ